MTSAPDSTTLRDRYTCFDVTIAGHIAHLTLNRPDKRNSMIREFWSELPQAIQAIDAGSLARVIVISSTGPHFSSGIDINLFGAEAQRAASEDAAAQRTRRIAHGADFHARVTSMQQTFTAIEQCRIPVIAAIQGGCLGGGVDLITACCIRYATADAYFSIFETNIGMTADVGTFPRLVKLIAEGIVRELAYTGRAMPAAEARAVGLVNAIYPDQATMLTEVMAIAKTITSKAPLAVHGCKRIITHARDNPTAATLDYVGLWNASFLSYDEIGEAMHANAQKRPAQFVDLPVMGGAIGEPGQA